MQALSVDALVNAASELDVGDRIIVKWLHQLHLTAFADQFLFNSSVHQVSCILLSRPSLSDCNASCHTRISIK
jgi:hypothetical protein